MGGKKYKYIVLMTDFGPDSYVGVMKGVIKNINPEVEILDLTHSIQPQNVVQAGYIIASSYKFYPSDSIFICVVDPGVGSKRDILIVETDKYLFLSPDNGLLSKILKSEKNKVIYKLNNEKSSYLYLKPVSYTFHGRDIFSPIAAHISKGMKIEKLGDKLSLDKITLLPFPEPVIKRNAYIGKYIFKDSFGNVVTNLENSLIKETKNYKFYIEFKSQKLYLPLVKSYSEVENNQLLSIQDSYGYIEVAIRNGNAYRFLTQKFKNIEKLKFVLQEKV